MQAVAEAVPAALGCDLVNIRVVGLDRELYLVAANGCTPMEIRARAFQPLKLPHVRTMLASGHHDRLALSLGISWSSAVWLVHRDEELATAVIASRTLRKPGEPDLAFFAEVAETLAARLATADRSREALSAAALRLARAALPEPWTAPGRVATLRPRERVVLELVADGLSTAEVASTLVISPHTVRTHVKHALRRLEVHTREEAAAIVRAEQLGQLL